MNTQKNFDTVLDEALEEVRQESLTPDEARAATERVWQRLAAEDASGGAAAVSESGELKGHDDYIALIPAYLAGELSPARALLLEAYSRESIPFRRTLKQARRGEAPSTGATPQRAATSSRAFSGTAMRWAAAAVLALGIGFIGWSLVETVPVPWGQTAEIAQLDGELFRVTDQGTLPLEAGRELPFGEPVRTARESGAVVRLADGSEIEMSARAEIELVRRARGTTIELHRGNIIVEAAKQRRGHLYVSTDDCLVSVKGTIFSVNSGTKGSRVSVLEGEVKVDYGTRHAVLEAGGQVSTHPSLGPVPLAQEIAWSRNIDDYLGLLSELKSLSRELEETMFGNELRYASTLVDLVPDETMLYVSIPNVSSNLSQAHQLIQERIATSPALKEWWETDLGGMGLDPMLSLVVHKIAAFGDFLGDEVAFSLALPEGVALDELEGPPGLLLLAETHDGEGLRSFLETELATLQASGSFTGMGDELPMVLVDDPAALPPADPDNPELLVWIHDGLLAAAVAPESLTTLADVRAGALNPFVTSPFHARLEEAFLDGIDYLVGADMSRVMEQVGKSALDGSGEEMTLATLEATGILDVEHLILEREKSQDRGVHHRMVVSFDGPRRGIAAWLEAPAPMASLDFMSPDASFVSAVLLKEPKDLLTDLFSLIEPNDEDFRQELEEFEAEHGVSVIDDFAAPLGGEMAVALDGPILPVPSWKVVVEVYDAARLQNSIRWVVDRINEEAEGSFSGVTLTQDDAGGRTYFTLTSPDLGAGVHYVFVDGYLLLAPSRVLLDRAIQYRDSGYSLATSPAFAALLPQDGHANFSGLTYQNLKSLMAPLMDKLAQGGSGLNDEQRQAVEELTEDAPATLGCIYGESDRIIFVSNSQSDIFGSLLSTGGALGLEDLLESALGDQMPTSLLAPAISPASTI